MGRSNAVGQICDNRYFRGCCVLHHCCRCWILRVSRIQGLDVGYDGRPSCAGRRRGLRLPLLKQRETQLAAESVKQPKSRPQGWWRRKRRQATFNLTKLAKRSRSPIKRIQRQRNGRRRRWRIPRNNLVAKQSKAGFCRFPGPRRQTWLKSTLKS